jgi:hypothetical protein
MREGNWAYIVDSLGYESGCFIPDIEVSKPESYHMYRAVKGYSQTLAVLTTLNPYTCIGWIKVERLGYKSAANWHDWSLGQ